MPSRCAERQARRTRRCELGCGRTSASSRSPTAFGASAATRSSSRVPTGSAALQTSRLDSTSSATWRRLTSRSAARFSIRKKLLSAASMFSPG